ncbi:hypothetical protein BCV69DRAFT_280185 [Microstroma glucosiphilum]|uniref:Vesicle tethering protein Uso1/P115-like head domain-containing protein n=1 Tax=Pseudomicrostroma glucosiphilum TaxID=1684307 RepID=A0A316UIY1_9BASI|nr:hypothetical protein BCV69DRAFT_280185 [Pseudomicrostroma glucosiphilum]PWN24291.1 hypothetical protein BCV69DRAFT_280185 [Pseudomicrostroma glucosiphilum]
MLHGVEWLGRQYSALSKGAAANQSLIQTINTFAQRLSQSSSAEDPIQERKAAILSLKGLAKDHAKEVADHAQKPLLDCLVSQASSKAEGNDDVARALVECLLVICTLPEPAPPKSTFGVVGSSSKKPAAPLVPAALDRFLDTPEPLHALLPLFSPTRTFYLRFASLQFLGLLLRHRKNLVQSHVLTSPGGCGAILECLSTTSAAGHSLGSSAEIIRNEALLILPHLVDSNADIQKLIAFEGAFEKLLDVVAQEGRIEGGVVVQDALEALEALLRYNVSNQNYFRETLSIPLLAPLLFYPPPLPPNAPAHIAGQREQQLESFAFQPWEYDAADEYEEEAPPPPPQSTGDGQSEKRQPQGPKIVGDGQKLINARLVVGIAGLLVQGVGEGKRANQNALLSTGFFHALLDLAVASSAPLSLKTQALQVLSLLLKSSRNVQDALGEASVTPVEPIKVQIAADLAGQVGQGEKAAPGALDGSAAGGAGSAAATSRMVEFVRLPPQSALLALVSAAVYGMAPPFRPIDGGVRSLAAFRAAAVKALQSILTDNIDARLFIIASMAVSEQSRPEDSPGHVLLQALTSLPTNGGAGAEEYDELRALFAGMILGTVIRGSDTVKDLAGRVRFGADGRTTIVDEPKEGSEEAKGSAGGKTDGTDDDEDEAASLLSVLIGNISVSLRSQSDALKSERSHQASTSTTSKGPSSASWTKILLAHLTVLALWLHKSPKSVKDLVGDSSNLQAVVQLVAEGANGEHLLVGLGTWVLGAIYEWGPAVPAPAKPAQGKGGKGGKGKADSSTAASNEPASDAITRQEVYDLVTSRIGLDQFEAKLDRLRDDSRLKLVGPDVLDKVGSRPDPIANASKEVKEGNMGGSAADEGEEGDLPEIWFDWNWAEFWRSENVTIANSMLVPPATTSSEASSAPAELLDAQRQIEQLRDEVKRLLREVESRDRLLAEGGQREGASREEREVLLKQTEEATSARDALQAELARAQASLEEVKAAGSRAAEAHASQLGASQERLVALEGSLRSEGEKAKGVEEQVKVLKEQLEAVSKKGEASSEAEGKSKVELQTLRAQVEELNEKIEEAEGEVTRLRKELEEESKKVATQTAAPAAEPTPAPAPAPAAVPSSTADSTRVAELEQENQDLLVMLDELSTKRKKDKQRLKEKGEEVSEDEDEDEDEEEDGDGDGDAEE